MPPTSIILPLYNGSRHVRQSVDSVLAQTWKDFELVVWDDGSRDASLEIIRSFDDPRIRIFQSERNRGLFTTLNLAIGEARGELIRLWAQDDVMKPQCLERERQYFRAHKGWGLAFSAFDVIDDAAQVLNRQKENSSADILPCDWVAQIMFFHGSITGNIANLTIPAAVLREIGPFREDMLVSGDFDMLERISARYPFLSIHDPVMYLRFHGGQFSHRKGVYPLHMREDAEIYARLRARLNLDARYARAYERCDRYAHYVHYAVRCLLDRDVENARKAYAEVARLDSAVKAGLWWLFTANGSLYHVKPRYTEDLAAFLCPSTV